MTTPSPQTDHASPAPLPSGIRVLRVGPREQQAALRRLMGAHPSDSAAANRFIEQARADHTDLSRMWMTTDHGAPGSSAPRQVCLAVNNAGRTAVLFVSSGLPDGPGGHTPPGAANAERTAVIGAACRALHEPEGGSVRLAQALLEPEETDLIASFQGAGFVRLAELAYLRRPIPRKVRDGPVVLPSGVELASLAQVEPTTGDALLREALERSYVDTLDCPALCGMRRLEDVIASHRAVGQYEPDLWSLVLADGRPEGCMLLNPCTAQDTVELVYVGLSPALRGKGVASVLLGRAFACLSPRPENTIACAVDVLNTPAMRLYRRARFKQFATRVAMVRPLEPVE